MIVGAHTILYSRDAEADRAFLRDVLGLPAVDAGHGWLVFGLLPGEVAVHPDEAGGRHELYLVCDDVRAFVRSLRRKGIACSPVSEQRWGALVEVTLPGGGRLGVYEPQHPRPTAGAGAGRKAARAAPRRTAKPAARRGRGAAK